MADITLVQIVDPKNKKHILKERKNMSRYTYNTEFAASRQIEARATLDGESFSIFMTYDEELFKVLKGFFEEKNDA